MVDQEHNQNVIKLLAKRAPTISLSSDQKASRSGLLSRMLSYGATII
ncbi:hypothetical protein JNM05_09620 [bacterium]|nr:hypothetical protein [bacterium]